MKVFCKLTIISIIAGAILASFLKVMQSLWNIQSYVLLFNMDYILLLRHFDDVVGSGYIFHFVFCFVSVVGLYYIAKIVHLESKQFIYIGVYTIGSGVLYFLSLLTNEPPEATSFISWFLWVIAHLIFGYVVALLINKWVAE